MKSREYTLRPANATDADAILRVHHDSVRMLCSADYSQEQIAAWIGQADDATWLGRALMVPGYQIVVAELYGSVAGFAERQGHEIFAVYVHPFHTRRGVASIMVAELERAARAAGLRFLKVDASVTAEAFYHSAGFELTQRGTHTFRDGTKIASLHMFKTFDGG